MPQDQIETFSIGGGTPAGADLNWGVASQIDAGGSWDPDQSTPAWLQPSLYAQACRLINTAGDGVGLGRNYRAFSFSTLRNLGILNTLLGYSAESLADNQFCGTLLLYNAALTRPLFQCQYVQLAGSVRHQVYGYGSGSPIQIGADLVLPASTPAKVRFRWDIQNPYVAGVSVNEAAELTQTISDVTRQADQLGAIIAGNSSFSTSVNAVTQWFAYFQMGTLESLRARRAAGHAIWPVVVAMFGHLFRRSAAGIYLPFQLPTFPSLEALA